MTDNSIDLFGAKIKEPLWKQEWKDMPEFVQEKKSEYAKIIVRFDNEQDLQDFAKMIGQKLTKRTKSIWHPHRSHWGAEKKEWVDGK
jgi:hypothetical protein